MGLPVTLGERAIGGLPEWTRLDGVATCERHQPAKYEYSESCYPTHDQSPVAPGGTGCSAGMRASCRLRASDGGQCLQQLTIVGGAPNCIATDALADYVGSHSGLQGVIASSQLAVVST